MVDSVDRRANKPLSTHKSAISSARCVEQRKAAGLCVACGVEPVAMRSYCYACSEKQQVMNARWGARKLLAVYGIDPTTARNELARLPRSRTVTGLIGFLEAIEKKV